MARHISVLCLTVLFAACATTVPVSPRVKILDSSKTRLQNQDAYFNTEYGRINLRRANFGFPHAEGNARPAKIISLALSGGGIRSNAFQLGVLAGLHEEPFGNATLYDRVDYISSVSGGTWANLAVWAWPDDLNALFTCLDNGAANGIDKAKATNPDCADALLMLRTFQRVKIFPTPWDQRKEVWQHDIENQSLKRCNPTSFAPLTDPCGQKALLTKPYFIVNSTHDSPGDLEDPRKNFPFETTADGIATVTDDGTRKGFMLAFAPEPEQWRRRKFLMARLHLPGGLPDGTTLSLTAAHSSAVFEGTFGGVRALFLDFYMQLANGQKGIHAEALRDHYVLADGGKSDDTGIVPLVDRGADIIVASYMGKDSVAFDDFDIADSHVTNLFGCKMSAIENRTPRHPATQRGTYSCPNAAEKAVLHVHPWPNNIDEFVAKFPADVSKYLREKDKDAPSPFPQTRTLQTRYDEPLIRAYYLLGRAVAKEKIAEFLRQQLQ